ncbi:unnamed protein product [Choristocarpus tenellus]
MLKLASPRGFKRRATVERGLVGLVLGALTIHAVMIMLGAPLIRNFRKTLASSLLLAAMTSLPVWISTESPLEACLETLIGARYIQERLRKTWMGNLHSTLDHLQHTA